MKRIGDIIGIVSAVVSIGAAVSGLAFWLGGIDSRMRTAEERLKQLTEEGQKKVGDAKNEALKAIENAKSDRLIIRVDGDIDHDPTDVTYNLNLKVRLDSANPFLGDQVRRGKTFEHLSWVFEIIVPGNTQRVEIESRPSCGPEKNQIPAEGEFHVVFKRDATSGTFEYEKGQQLPSPRVTGVCRVSALTYVVL